MAIPYPPGFVPPPKASVWFAKIAGAAMWFWILYRAKKDGPHLLVLHLDDVVLSIY